MKTKRIGLFFVILGVVCVISGCVLFAVNRSSDAAANDNAEKALDALHERIEERADGVAQEGDAPEDMMVGEGVMPYVVIDSYAYIGTLTVPQLELELPVLASWDYDALQIAPALYSGSVYGNDMVIAAHNYRSHFGRLNTLYTGAEIRFTDVNGKTTLYTIVEGEELDPDEVKRMKQSDYDLTLFTCNFDGTARFTVRCDRA